MVFLKQKVFPLLLPKSLGGEGPTALICGMYLECIEIALRCVACGNSTCMYCMYSKT